ncbi:MAG: EndoU domain-containing protein [Acidobacteriota bacterium]|nr:EndoU domain-containing protein [Acidobacteriota bacterium]
MRRAAVLLGLALSMTIALPAAGSRHRGGEARGVRWSATTPRVNETHIFEGGINRRGRPVGFHSRPGGQDPSHARVVAILRQPNGYGVYEARVAIAGSGGGWVEKRSTFYPDRLGREAVVAAIVHAYQNRAAGGGSPFRGPSGLGFTIEGYLLGDGSINTAYPIY